MSFIGCTPMLTLFQACPPAQSTGRTQRSNTRSCSIACSSLAVSITRRFSGRKNCALYVSTSARRPASAKPRTISFLKCITPSLTSCATGRSLRAENSTSPSLRAMLTNIFSTLVHAARTLDGLGIVRQQWHSQLARVPNGNVYVAGSGQSGWITRSAGNAQNERYPAVQDPRGCHGG